MIFAAVCSKHRIVDRHIRRFMFFGQIVSYWMSYVQQRSSYTDLDEEMSFAVDTPWSLLNCNDHLFSRVQQAWTGVKFLWWWCDYACHQGVNFIMPLNPRRQQLDPDSCFATKDGMTILGNGIEIPNISPLTGSLRPTSCVHRDNMAAASIIPCKRQLLDSQVLRPIEETQDVCGIRLMLKLGHMQTARIFVMWCIGLKHHKVKWQWQKVNLPHLLTQPAQKWCFSDCCYAVV